MRWDLTGGYKEQWNLSLDYSFIIYFSLTICGLGPLLQWLNVCIRSYFEINLLIKSTAASILAAIVFFPFTQHAAAATVRMHKSQAVSFVCSSECECMKSTGDMLSTAKKIQIKNASSSYVSQSADSMEKHVVVFFGSTCFSFYKFSHFWNFPWRWRCFKRWSFVYQRNCLPLVRMNWNEKKQNKIIERFTVNSA